jgi:hypothetical protein
MRSRTGPNEPPRPGTDGGYRAELSGRALKHMHGLPSPAFDSLIEAMADVIDYPDDPFRTYQAKLFLAYLLVHVEFQASFSYCRAELRVTGTW